jgi:DNA-binding NtrC family response regulator
MEEAKILLVDDEVVFTNNISRLLANRGYRVTAVYDGESAIRVLEKEQFDVVVLDLRMPGIDGIITLAAIKKLGLFTEILLLTGYGSMNTAVEAMKLGAYDYLSKPCDVDELVAKIEEVWKKIKKTRRA